MNIHYLQHVPFEGLGSIEPVLRDKGHKLSSTHLYRGEELPAPADPDWLIVMGGPMGIYDDHLYDWLSSEKRFIEQVIEAGKKVLGICLGAQLIGDVLGAAVYKNRYREIGWFPIEPVPEAGLTILGPALSSSFEVFHWHGDTFDIPHGAVRLAASEACSNQGFIYDNRVVALQFHLETTFTSAQELVENCQEELDGSRYVQTAEQILADQNRFSLINKVMATVLAALEL